VALSPGPAPTAESRAAIRLAGYAGFILIGWNAVLIPSLIRSVEQAFHQSDAAFGFFYFLSALVYAAGSLGGGFVTERVGRRPVLALAALLLGVGLAGEAGAPSWLLVLAAALPVNLGAGAIDGGVNGLFLDLFREARGGALSLLHVFFSVGALLAPFSVGQLVAAGVGWRILVLIPGAAALALAAYFGSLPMPSGHAGRAVPATDQVDQTERSLLPFAGLAVAICLYVAGEVGVSSWLVRFLSGEPVALATAVLSGFWGGLALGRLVSNRVAERFDYTRFIAGCFAATAVTTVAASIVPMFPLAAALFGLAGFFSGPIYPMIMALGGDIYPHRLAALSGSLGASAVIGSVTYPALVGVTAARVGLRTGMVGAGLLSIPGALAVLAAAALARRMES